MTNDSEVLNMSSDAGSDVFRVENSSEVIRDVVEFARRVRIALSLSKFTEMGVIVHDHTSQLCALVEQGGFVLLGLGSELGLRRDPEISLRVYRDPENRDLYRVEGLRISIRKDSNDVSSEQVSDWLSENGVDACGNITVEEVPNHIHVLIDALT